MLSSAVVIFTIAIFILSFFCYKAGIKNKENEILKENEKLKKLFEKNNINSNDDLFDRLSKGDF